jgi:hypothetical protein
MNAIVIEFHSDRAGFGTLKVEDAFGNILLGPWIIALSNDSVGLVDPLVDYASGDGKRVREFFVDGIVPISEGSESDVKQYGRYGIVRLRPLRASKATASREVEFDECYVYGGELSFNDLAPVSPGSFRLRPEHHRSLVNLLKTQALPVSCRVIEERALKLQESSVVSLAALESSRSTTLRIASLAAAAAVAVSPFVLFSTKVEAQCCSSGKSYSAVDFIQLAALEGGSQFAGHVPNEESGVNIAAGFDLGVRTEQDLIDMGFSGSQIRLLNPYLALSRGEPLVGFKARQVLESTPLSISPLQAEEINNLVFSWHANYVGSQFNREIVKQGILRDVAFSNLPSRLQTAMANMFIADSSFVESEAFVRFASGEWSAGLRALAEYPTSKPAVLARAKAAAASLSELATRSSVVPS